MVFNFPIKYIVLGRQIDDKAARHYQGELESNAIVSFVNRERASSGDRKLGGTLSSDAGRNVDATV